MILKVSVSQFYNELPLLEYLQHREQSEARELVTDEPGHCLPVHSSTWRSALDVYICYYWIIYGFIVCDSHLLKSFWVLGIFIPAQWVFFLTQWLNASMKTWPQSLASHENARCDGPHTCIPVLKQQRQAGHWILMFVSLASYRPLRDIQREEIDFLRVTSNTSL